MWKTAATRKSVLNYIWLALVLLAVAIGGWNDRLKDVTEGAFDGAKTAVTIALGLIGIMALWLGVMRLAERAGLVQRIARGLRPIMRRLFPDVPPEHPAMGDLESLNPHPGVATNAMCTFLAINTSSVQLIPATAIAILVASGSTRPTAIVGTALLATLCAASVAIISVKLLEKLSIFRISPADQRTKLERDFEKAEIKEKAGISDPGYSVSQEPPRRLSILGWIALAGLVLFFLALFVRMVAPNLFGIAMAPEATTQNVFVRSVNALSILAIPFLLSFFPLCAAARGVKVYDEFVE